LLSAVLVPFAISSPSVPVVVPGFAVTVHVVPLPVTLVTLAPVPPVRLKLAGVSPVTLSFSVTVQVSADELDGLVPARLIETTFGAIV
jgi:hypothetical protein